MALYVRRASVFCMYDTIPVRVSEDPIFSTAACVPARCTTLLLWFRGVPQVQNTYCYLVHAGTAALLLYEYEYVEVK